MDDSMQQQFIGAAVTVLLLAAASFSGAVCHLSLGSDLSVWLVSWLSIRGSVTCWLSIRASVTLSFGHKYSSSSLYIVPVCARHYRGTIAATGITPRTTATLATVIIPYVSKSRAISPAPYIAGDRHLLNRHYRGVTTVYKVPITGDHSKQDQYC